MRPSALPPLSALRPLIERYDFFIIDQWAVMHNGMVALEGAREAMRAMVGMGKTVLTLSNSSRSRRSTRLNLARLGFDENHHYHEIMTSGADVRDHLRARRDSFYRGLGRRCHVMRFDDDFSILDGLDYSISGHGADPGALARADWVLCAGIEAGCTPEDYKIFLEAARERSLPMVCANPDLLSKGVDGSLHACPGAIAQAYESMGGAVRWHGKPRLETYRSCFQLLRARGLDVEALGGLGIGDSLRHDIAGAKGAGLDAALVTRGIHAGEWRRDEPHEIFQRYGVTPDYCLDALRL